MLMKVKVCIFSLDETQVDAVKSHPIRVMSYPAAGRPRVPRATAVVQNMQDILW